MKRILIFIMLLSAIMTLKSQNTPNKLAFERIESGAQEVFSNKENWAEIIVQCKSDYNLNFTVPGEKIVDLSDKGVSIENLSKKQRKAKAILARKTIKGNDTEYTLWLRVTNSHTPVYLVISPSPVNTQDRIIINLDGLQPKSRQQYRLYNPNDANDGSVFQRHNVLGKELFNDNNYVAARQEFVLASYCDARPSEKEVVQKMIANCDSMIMYTAQIEQYVNNEQWTDAMDCTRKAGKLNPQDKYLINTYYYCYKKRINDSNLFMAEAQDLYDRGKYTEAKVLYDKVANLNGPLSAIAKQRSQKCTKTYKMESNRERYIGLEYGLGNMTSFGITNGKYSNRLGTYQSYRINSDIINMLRLRFNLNEHARLDITPLSLTFPVYRSSSDIFRGVWLNAGVGVTVVNCFKPKSKFMDWALANKYVTDEEGVTQELVDTYLDEIGSNSTKDALKLNPYFAATPEGGVVVKVWRLALRFTYRHYIPFNKDMTDYTGRSQFSIGLGYCY